MGPWGPMGPGPTCARSALSSPRGPVGGRDSGRLMGGRLRPDEDTCPTTKLSAQIQSCGPRRASRCAPSQSYNGPTGAVKRASRASGPGAHRAPWAHGALGPHGPYGVLGPLRGGIYGPYGALGPLREGIFGQVAISSSSKACKGFSSSNVGSSRGGREDFAGCVRSMAVGAAPRRPWTCF